LRGGDHLQRVLATEHNLYDDVGVTDRTAVHRWIADYERAWRTSGTDGLSALFSTDATYAHSPYEEPIVGIPSIAKMWEEDRDGPDEVFTLSTEIVAVDGATAVVRAEVQYGEPIRQEYRDLTEARASIQHFLERVYNQKRLHSALDYRPPEEFEQHWQKRRLEAQA